jgi:DNA-binding NarL/FixJ family response regulator
VILLAARADEPYVRMMLEAGARGYVAPDDPALGRAVRALAMGGAYFSPNVATVVRRGYLRRGWPVAALLGPLTETEREVLSGLVQGQTLREIGTRLHLSLTALHACRCHIAETLAS